MSSIVWHYWRWLDDKSKIVAPHVPYDTMDVEVEAVAKFFF